MSTILGSFQSCKTGNHTASITCNGPSCHALQMIPGLTCTNNTSGSMTCTNGNKCDTPSNLTSSFALQGNGQTITQTHNVTISGLTYRLVGSGGKITNLNGTTAKKSAATPIPSPGYKLLLFIGFLLFSTQALAQSPIIGSLPVIDDEYATALGSLLEPLNLAMCEVAETPTNNLLELAVVEIDVLLACLVDLMVTVLALPGTLAEGDSEPTAWGSSLPITDPATLFAAAAGDAILCLQVAEAILSDPSGATEQAICAPILAAAPPPSPTITAFPSAAATSVYLEPSEATSPYPVASTGLPDLWPDTDVWESAGTCRGCEFSIFLGLAQVNDCNITNPPLVASDIAQWICGPNETASTPFGPLCSSLCSNSCGTWSWDAIVKSMGSAFIAGLEDLSDQNVGACLDPCSNEPAPMFDYGTYTCPPPFNNTGTPACACGTGRQACSPTPGFQPGGNPNEGDPRCIDAFGQPFVDIY